MPTAPSPARFSRASRSTLLLLLVALRPYLRTLAFGYVMDDTTVIRSNPDINGWDSLARVWMHPYGGPDSPYFGLYRPLTMTLFAFVWNAGGQWPLWFHLLAMLLHATATVLVWRMLERVTGSLPALVAAVWFAVHPVHVEAVANVANSSEVLVAVWTCLLVLHVARASATADRIGWATAVVAGVLYLAAFLSKESGAVAPALAVLWIWGEGTLHPTGARRNLSTIGARWWRVLVACALAAAVVMAGRAAVLGGPITGEPIAAAGLVDDPVKRAWSMLSLGPTILRLLVWPAGLNPHYGPTTFDPQAQSWLAALTLVTLALAIVAGVMLARRGERRVLVATAWIVLAFLPASNILVATGQVLAERTLYVSSIGVAVLLTAAIDGLRARIPNESRWRRLVPAGLVVATALLAAAALQTARGTEIWRTHTSLFARMIAADPLGYRGYWLSGLEARDRRQTREALSLLGRAYMLYPQDRGLMIDYSETLTRAGNPRRAAEVAVNLMASSRHRTRPYAIALYLNALGGAFGPDSVIAAGQRLMSQAPSATAALFVGHAREQRGDKAGAMQAYREGLRVAPGDSALQMRVRILGVSR
jgi:hypothetical protein